MTDNQYLLPLSKHCEESCELCRFVGCRNPLDRSTEDILRALKRAKSGGYKSVLFPFHFLGLAEFTEIVEACRLHQLSLRVRINPQSQAWQKIDLLRLRATGTTFEWMIDTRNEASSLSDPAWIEKVNERDQLTFVVFRNSHLIQWLNTLPAPLLEKARFYFPIPTAAEPNVLKPGEIYQLGIELKRRFLGLSFLPPIGYEIFEPRTPSDFCYEPNLSPQLMQTIENAAPLISVIIPTYNNRDYLLATLDHLAGQTLPTIDYEIIVVDDGSTDGTDTAIEQWLGNLQRKINFKYIYFQRTQKRQMGDNLYRAGIARNLGAKSSRGGLLAFLDSDIITPPHYLEDLILRHQDNDVVQCLRLNLKEIVSHRRTRYEHIDPYRHTDPFEGEYWNTFYSTYHWPDLPFFWKYTCTYGLSLSREVFEKVGRIRRTFVFYGFEDTDLGYRLAQLGYRFQISDTVTYHLHHSTARSEFANSSQIRHNLLKNTATIFYLNHLAPEIVEHFHGFFDVFIPAKRKHEQAEARP